MELQYNYLTNSLPRNLRYNSFVYFKVTGNNLTGLIPSVLLNGLNVEFIMLEDNCFTGSVPEVINGNSVLLELHLYLNLLHGGVPTSLLRLKNLEEFSLGKNNMDGSTIPTVIGKVKSLLYLNLCSMGLVGTVPTQIGALSLLQTLRLNENRLTGILPLEVCLLEINTLVVDCIAYDTEDRFFLCCDE